MRKSISEFSTISEPGRPGLPSRRDTMLLHERRLWDTGIRHVAGIDEAGRGPLAGPVVAAAVIVSPDFFLPEVDDSKRISPTLREGLFRQILEGATAVGIGIVDHDMIDRVNILNATYEAMHRAVASLPVVPEFLLIDGNRFRGQNIPFHLIVGGDGCSFSVAAASIIAKVTRDQIMQRYDGEYPGYGFAQHKGYGTPGHLRAILRLGLSPIHRRSFRHGTAGDSRL